MLDNDLFYSIGRYQNIFMTQLWGLKTELQGAKVIFLHFLRFFYTFIIIRSTRQHCYVG